MLACESEIGEVPLERFCWEPVALALSEKLTSLEGGGPQQKQPMKSTRSFAHWGWVTG